MSKLLTTVASAALLLTATGAYANDYDHTSHNAGKYSTIQKGESASTKSYGYNKQGDHYSTRNAYRNEWNNSYPGAQASFGTKEGVVIKKGGSGISDASTEASTRQYGAYWN